MVAKKAFTAAGEKSAIKGQNATRVPLIVGWYTDIIIIPLHMQSQSQAVLLLPVLAAGEFNGYPSSTFQTILFRLTH